MTAPRVAERLAHVALRPDVDHSHLRLSFSAAPDELCEGIDNLVDTHCGWVAK
jgi:hypothetical protein